MSWLWIILILLLIICWLIRKKYLEQINYWKSNNVELISVWEFISKSLKAPTGLVIDEYYQQMFNEQIPFKVIEGLIFTLVIVQDLEAVKQIMITNFENFPERGFYVNPKDRLSTTILREGHAAWKPLRQIFTPTLSPSKMKFMFPTLQKVGAQLVALMEQQCERGIQEMEIYDLCARYTTDNIGSVIFGLECNSLQDPNTEFRIQGDRSIYQLKHPCVDQFAVKYSKLMQALNFRVHDKKMCDFFTRVITETIEYREKHNIRRPDMLDIVMQMRNEKAKDDELPMTISLIVGQMFGFFQAGYQTSAATICFALYELAKNQTIQEKARLEVLHVMAECGNELTYECLKNLTYVKQIGMETLRKYPPAPCISRICRTPCTLETSTVSLTILRDISVIIPFYGLQHNPAYYPEPEIFRPERFSEQETAKRPACTFLTFGIGPRMCLGESFGKMQTTLGIALLLSKFRFSVCEKTPNELKFDPKCCLLLFVKDGVHLKVEKL